MFRLSWNMHLLFQHSAPAHSSQFRDVLLEEQGYFAPDYIQNRLNTFKNLENFELIRAVRLEVLKRGSINGARATKE